MHYNLSDQYQPRESLVHQLDPRVKLALTFLIILCIGLVPEGAWLAFLMLGGLLLIALLLSGLGPFFTLRRSILVLPFVLAAFSVPFTVPGEAIFRVPAVGWTVTEAGMVRFVSILLRAWLAVQIAILMTATTPFPHLLWGLGALRLPGPLVSILSFMYRYLFVLADEAYRILRARASRSADLAGHRRPPILWHAKVAGGMVGALFLRSLDRSERVYAAMLSRGYDGKMRTMERFTMARVDWIVSLLVALMLVMILLLGSRG